MNMERLVLSNLLMNSMRLIIFLILSLSTVFYTKAVVPFFVPVGAVEAPAALGNNVDVVIEMFVHDTSEVDKITKTNWRAIAGVPNPVDFILTVPRMPAWNIPNGHWSFVIVTSVVASPVGTLQLYSWLANAIFVSGTHSQPPAPLTVVPLQANQQPVVNGIQLAYYFFHPDANPQAFSHSERAICEFLQRVQPPLPAGVVGPVLGSIVHIFNQRRACLQCYHCICNNLFGTWNAPVTACIRHYSLAGRPVIDVVKSR